MVVNEKFASLLARLGLKTEASIRSCSGELVKNHKGRRDILRLDLRDNEGQPLTLFLKRIWRQNLKDGLRSLLCHGRVWSVSRSEWENALALQSAGLHTPELIAYGEECGWFREHFSFLLTRAAPPPHTLEYFIRECRQAGVRRKVFGALAREVRQLHEAGLSMPDLFTRHLFVAWDDAAPLFYWIDVARLDRRRHIPPRWRARDLAALNVTTPLSQASTRERLRFLNVYAGRLDRTLIRRIQVRTHHLLRRRKHRNYLS